MVYVPPKYPSEIPSAEDLPNRQDDVHWIKAARYNELKKELRAALTELGVLPKGGYADVRARLDAIVGGFTDRGDPTEIDFSKADLINDGAWHDLDLSDIIPVTARCVLLHLIVTDDLAGSFVGFRKKGNIYAYNQGTIRTQVANYIIHGEIHCACGADRIIQYVTSYTTFTTINLTVRGWWE